MSQTRTVTTAAPKQTSSFRRAALTTTPIALVGSLALTLGVGEAARAADQHVVEPGDTVTGIAIRNGLQTRDVMAWNGLHDATIHPGQKLRLSAPSSAKTASSGSSSQGTHTVGSGDTLWSIAQEHGISVDRLLRANDLKASAVIYPGQKLKLSGKGSSGSKGSSGAKQTQAKTASSGSSSGATHTVSSGETIWSIAREHGTSVKAILRANDLGESAVIHPGQKLRVSGSGSSSGSESSSGSSGSAAPAAQSSSGKTHTVSSGDTLWAIAAEHDTSVKAILAANDLSSGAIIYPGQKLKIGGSGGGSTSDGGSAKQPSEGTSQLSASLDDEQLGNAKLIIRTGREIGASDRAIATALATAMVESSMRNVSYGDRDSLGLFQQRPSQGWGTRAQLTDPHRATRVFFGGAHDPNGDKSRGLYDIPGWSDMSFGAAAQAVQVSAHPGRYARWETQAYRWLNELG